MSWEFQFGRLKKRLLTSDSFAKPMSEKPFPTSQIKLIMNELFEFVVFDPIRTIDILMKIEIEVK